MMKRITRLLLAAVMIFSLTLGSLGVTASAAGYEVSLSDYADMLDTNEEEQLKEYMKEAADDIGCNIGIVIADDTNGATSKEYADNYMDTSFGYGEDSIVLLYNNDFDHPDHVDWISTYGLATEMYADEIDQIFDYLYEGYDSYGGDNYYKGAIYFCDYLKANRSVSESAPQPEAAPDTVSNDTIMQFFGAVGYAIIIAGGVLSA